MSRPARPGRDAMIGPGESGHGQPEPPDEAPPETLLGRKDAPAARAPKYDRWAHRRGEPRVFALLWTVYLMLATGLALASVGVRGQVPVDVYRPVAKVLLLTVAAGVVLVWPLVRLSQARPGGGGAWASMTDFFVVILPVQAIVWPQTWLTGWPLEVIGAISAMMASWGLLMAGMLAWALGPGTGWEGKKQVEGATGWMVALVAMVTAGPMLGWAGALAMGDLASPLTGVFSLTAGLPVGSLGVSVTRAEWTIILIPGMAGAAGWLAAWVRE